MDEVEESRRIPGKQRPRKKKVPELTTAQKRAAQYEIAAAAWHERAIQEARIAARRRAVEDAGGVLND